MPEISPYGVTQHADADLMTANAMVGEQVTRVHQNAPYGSHSLDSTAPYRGPNGGRRRCIAKGGTCKAPPMIGAETCYYHVGKEGNEPAVAP